jgi:hypothetical protein
MMLIVYLAGLVLLIWLLNELSSAMRVISWRKIAWERWVQIAEIVAAVALVATAVFAVIGAWIATIQLGETREERRAWVGPTHASMNEPSQPNSPLFPTVSLRNTGREPALNSKIYFDQDPLTVAKDDPTIHDIEKGFATKCKTKDPPLGISAIVIYPTSSEQQVYAMHYNFPKDKVDEDLVNGEKIILLRGCVVYESAAKVRHSAFCYYYRKGETGGVDMPLCDQGNDVD